MSNLKIASAAYSAGYANVLEKVAVSYNWVAQRASAGARTRGMTPEGVEDLVQSARRAGHATADSALRAAAGAPMRGRDEKRNVLLQHMLRPLVEDSVAASGGVLPASTYRVIPKRQQLSTTATRRGPAVDVPPAAPDAGELFAQANESLVRTLLLKR